MMDRYTFREEFFTAVSSAVYLLTFPGTVVHELGHYAVARLLGVPIDEVVWFNHPSNLFDRSNDRLGWVRYGVESHEIDYWKRASIAVAPLLSNGLGVWGILTLSNNITYTPLVYICWWLAFSFLLHLIPSVSDSHNILLAAETLPPRIRPFGRFCASVVEFVVRAGPIFFWPLGFLIAALALGWVSFEVALIQTGIYTGIVGPLSIVWDMWNRRTLNPLSLYAHTEIDYAVSEQYNLARTADETVGDLDRLIEGLRSDKTHIRRTAMMTLLCVAEDAPEQLEPVYDDLAAVLEDTSDDYVHTRLLVVSRCLVEAGYEPWERLDDEFARGLCREDPADRAAVLLSLLIVTKSDIDVAVGCAPSVAAAVITGESHIREIGMLILVKIASDEPRAVAQYAHLFVEYIDARYSDKTVRNALVLAQSFGVEGAEEKVEAARPEPDGAIGLSDVTGTGDEDDRA